MTHPKGSERVVCICRDYEEALDCTKSKCPYSSEWLHHQPNKDNPHAD